MATAASCLATGSPSSSSRVNYKGSI